MPNDNENQEDSRTVDGSAVRKSFGRRSILKGAVTAMPAILTLHSGAALARSSNLISTTKYKSPDAHGRTLCLDLRTVERVRGRKNTYDMGPNPYAHVNAINERDYFVKRNGRRRRIDVKALCERGGIAQYRDSGWKKIKLPKGGGMLSAAPIASFAGDIHITDL